jgi:acyl carrier protein
MTTLNLTEQITATAAESIDEERIAHWLRRYIADLLALPEEKIDLDVAFQRIGLDSSAAVAMTGDLSDWLGCDVDPSAAYEHSTIFKLSHAVYQEHLKAGNDV